MNMMRWLARLWWAALLGLASLGLALVIALGWVLSTTVGTSVKDTVLSEDTVLHWSLDGNVTYSKEALGLFASLMQTRLDGSYSLFALKRKLRKAATDSKVKALVLEFGELRGGIAELMELRKLLAQFKESGKKLIVWAPRLSDFNYLLASVADRILIPPAGELKLSGPSLQTYHVRSALDKLGIKMEAIRAGRYKSAIESYTSDAPSADSKHALNSLVDDLTSTFVSVLGQARGAKPLQVHQWIKNTFFSAEEALEAGLVDELSYWPKLVEDLEALGKLEDFDEYHPTPRPRESTREGVAFITARGNIGAAVGEEISDVSFQKMHQKLKWAAQEEKVKAIVLYVDSPGGSVLQSDMIWNDIKLLNAKKPVVTVMGGHAASGGYYIAAGSTKIIALPLTITGSIGVFGLVPKAERVSAKWGISLYLFTKSERKSLLLATKKISQADRQLLQSHIDHSYKNFLQRIAAGRNKKLEDLDHIAQGRVWSGKQALERGLVDQLGSVMDGIKEAARLGKLAEEDDIAVHFYSSPLSLQACLASDNPLLCLRRHLAPSAIEELSAALNSGIQKLGISNRSEDIAHAYSPIVWRH